MRASRPLVGRVAELQTLQRTLARGAPGMSVVAVAGEPGIGKTRLLEEAARIAERGGRHVRGGQATELERDTPYASMVDAFASFDEAERRRIAALRADQRDQLAAVFPALADLGEPRAEGLHRYHSHHAIRRMLEVLARRVPLALLLDDLHWADQASTELLAHVLRRPPDAPLALVLRRPPDAPLALVLRRPPDAPLALVLAFRPAELGPPLHRALDTVEREHGLARLALAPLSQAEAEELIGGEAGWDLRASLYRDSGGNPLYLEQLLGAAARGDRAASVPAHPRMPGVPSAVRRALAGELELLPDDARLAAHAAAVLGEAFSADLLSEVAGLEGDATAAALDRLIEADIVRPTRSPALRFRHPIVRRAIYDDAPAAWRTAAHARAGQALAARRAPVLQRAHHVERSAGRGDRAAFDVLVDAGRIGARVAPSIAARWFEAAQRLLPPGSSDEDELPLLFLLGVCLGMAGELHRSRAVLAEALARGAPTAPDRGAVAAFAAGIDHLLGRHDDARALLADALRDAAPGSAEAAALLAELAWDRWFSSDWVGLADDADRARDAARAAGDDLLEANAAALLGLTEAARGQLAQGALAEARAIVDRLPEVELSRRVTALFAIGAAEGQVEDYAAAYRHLAFGAELAQRTGQESLLVLLETGVALAATFQGNLDEARRHLAVALDVADLYDLEHLRGWAEMIHCLHALRSGDVEGAVAAGARAEQAFATIAVAPPAAWCCWCAEAWIEAGSAEHVPERLLAMCGGPSMPDLQPAYRTAACEILSRAALALGDHEDAAAWAERAERLSTGQAFAGTTIALRARAAVALAAGHPRDAARLALDSAAAAARPGAVIESLRSRLLAGEALAAAGKRERAVAELLATHEQAAACGANRLRDEAAAHLRALGRPARSPSRRARRGDGLAALSERERQVADLVTERLTNREIAERLVLSPKTVERHLARICEALGISSRVELARQVERARDR